MAYNDPNARDDIDESADTASFQRFVEHGDSGQDSTTGSGRGFRLLSLGVGLVVLVVIVALLFQ